MKLTAAVNKDYFDYTIVYKAGENNGGFMLYSATMDSQAMSLNIEKRISISFMF